MATRRDRAGADGSMIPADVPGAAEQLRHLFRNGPTYAGDTLSHEAIRALCEAGLARRDEAVKGYEITERGVEYLFGPWADGTNGGQW